MSKPLASLSLDLDNKWSYMKTHGDAGWEAYPSYLDVVVPRVLDVLRQLDLKITFFVVGQDAALEKNRSALAAIAEDGHEIGNHSFHHEPWLKTYSLGELRKEFEVAEEAIEGATGRRTIGFRGPGFSWSDDLLRVLAERGYRYDASTFPTFLGPAARAYYFMTAKLSPEEKERRKELFGRFSEGFRSLKPYWWCDQRSRVLEIPVTTMPFFKAPFHVSYLLYLAQYSRLAAKAHFSLALRLCRLSGVEPSLLLHPLDFLGGDDDGDLSFFPAMKSTGEAKTRFVTEILRTFAEQFAVTDMETYASTVARRAGLPQRDIERHTASVSTSSPPLPRSST